MGLFLLLLPVICAEQLWVVKHKDWHSEPYGCLSGDGWTAGCKGWARVLVDRHEVFDSAQKALEWLDKEGKVENVWLYTTTEIPIKRIKVGERNETETIYETRKVTKTVDVKTWVTALPKIDKK